MALVDVVVVTFNSAREIRSCVEPLSRDESVRVIVVDNASSDDTLGSVADLPVETVLLNVNKGFAHGCNEGWRRGNSPLVLFLNPDARITSDGLHHLVRELQGADGAGAAAPKILHADGTLDYSQRRFPSLVSTYA
ncbi:MAG: glycosyltransferase family 2 protein, partial [Gaiellaceae bacterium]